MKQPSVLLVDDEESILTTLGFSLRKQGYQVETASNGQEGIDKFMSARPDMIVTDLMMEGTTGIDLLKEVKRIDPETEVIVLTGFASVDTAIEALQLGAFDYLQKPCNRSELSLKLGKGMERRELKRKITLINNNLVEANNKLKEEIKERHAAEDTLENINDHLENLVEQRSSFLISANEKLKSEIIERTKIEHQLVQAKDEAIQFSKAKSEFLSQMSHELRTPLNAVIGFSELLLTDTVHSLTHQQREQIDEILSAGTHLLELINEILDLSYIERGIMQIELQDIDINSVIQETLLLIVPLAQQREIIIENQVPPNNTVPVKSDKKRLKQVLINLISNAIKYNKLKGSITLSLDASSSDKVSVSISDTGVGMSNDQLEKIFDPFYRANHGGKFVEGAGIGLTVTKGIVDAMKGTIAVESKLDEGSRFTLELPKA